MSATRLDKYLVSQGYCSSREQAHHLIDQRYVTINGFVALKHDRIVKSTDNVSVSKPLGYQLKGALKLKKFFSFIPLDVAGLKWVDLGSSSGGFISVLIEKDVAEIVGVDVGKNLLVNDLQGNSKVKILENTNSRYLTVKDIGFLAQGVTVDLSFISLCLISETLRRICAPNAIVIALVKPQFEAGRVDASKARGIIKNPRVWKEVLVKVTTHYSSKGFEILNIVPVELSPLKNREFFLHMLYKPQHVTDFKQIEKRIEEVITSPTSMST